MAMTAHARHTCSGRLAFSQYRSSRSAGSMRPFQHAADVTVPQLRCNSHHLPRCRQRVLVAASAAPSAATLPTELKKIVELFNMVPDPKLKYQQLLAYAKKLPPMPAEHHTEDNKVRGCVSQVWVMPELRDGKLFWQADSDSALTKGLAALLVQGLSGCAPEEVAALSPDWIAGMGLQQSLTPSRNNGFFNMYALMRKKAADLCAAGPLQGDGALGGGGADTAAASTSGGGGATDGGVAELASASNGNGSGQAAPPVGSGKPVRASMERKLTEALQPQSLTIVDESDQHAGHAGSRMLASPSGETHFRVGIVSAAFSGLNTVKRHRLVYQILKDELAGPVHALSLDTKALEEVGS